MKQYKSQTGFTLIEILIAILVVGFGLAGLAKLHSELVQEAGESKNKLIALNLIKEKVADLKQFETLSTTTGMLAFEDIGNNVGGSMAAGAYDGFTLSWCVNSDNCNGQAHQGDFYYTAVDSTPTNVDPGTSLVPDFKKVKIIVSWPGQDGQTKTLSTDTVVIPKLSAQAGIVATATTELVDGPTSTGNGTVQLPDGRVDNGDGTVTVTRGNFTIIMDEDTGDVVSINGVSGLYKKISGTITIYSGNPAPKTTDVDALNVTADLIPCVYPYNAGTGYYECYYLGAYIGTVTMSGYDSRDSSCPANTYSYISVLTNQENQDFLIKRSC